MNILIANDDGIQAEGIRALAQALAEKGNVYVVAPDTQRSASSHALSIHGEMRAEEVPDFPGAKHAWKLSGTPADCVKLGLEILRRKGLEKDIVYAGINHGANMGTDTMYSGTVSAAAEGMLAGYPAVAVSVCSHFPEHFEAACSLAVKVFDRALETAGKGYLISINTPNLPQQEIKGVRMARLGQMTYDEWFEEKEEMCFRYVGEPVKRTDHDPDIDVRLIEEGWATISTIKYDLNDYEALKQAENWRITL